MEPSTEISTPRDSKPNSNPNWMWIGPDGLRAGWGITLWLIIVVVVARVFFIAVFRLHIISAPTPHQDFMPRFILVQEGVLLFGVLLATWVMSKIEGRPFGTFGLGGNRRRVPQSFQGFAAGFVVLSLVIGGLYASHAIVFNGTLTNGPAAIKYGLIWLVGYMAVGLFEESAFRGYLQFTLARGLDFSRDPRKRGWGFWIAALVFNALFGLAHRGNAGESPIGLVLAGAIGVVFCASLWYTRSLWWAIGFHATWDWAESFFYGTADSGTVDAHRFFNTHPQGSLLLSGGPTGPEGSYWAIGAVALTALIVWATLRRERDKSTEQALVNPIESEILAIP